ncbi:MAG: protease inhibitor I42 family protein [Acidimicrobiia bacterium]
MFRKYWLLPVIAVAAVVALSVGLRSNDSTTHVAADATGTTVTLHVGDTLEIQLDGNPTTGYGWETISDESGVLIVNSDPTYTTNGDLIGSGGTYLFSFTADKVGGTDVNLVYRRPWETEVAPIASFTLHVVIR